MKAALITGANKGIGFGLAKHLGLSGWQIIIGARNQHRAEKAIDELTSLGIKVLGWVSIELSDQAGLAQAAKEISEKYPDLTLLVNNAGIPGDMSVDGLHTQMKDIHQTIDVNFIGTFNFTQQMIPLLTKNHGRIVNITVPSEISPYWHPLAYVASKAAQNAMMGVRRWSSSSKALRWRYSPYTQDPPPPTSMAICRSLGSMTSIPLVPSYPSLSTTDKAIRESLLSSIQL